jgi:hypothetical protein
MPVAGLASRTAALTARGVEINRTDLAVCAYRLGCGAFARFGGCRTRPSSGYTTRTAERGRIMTIF